MKSDCIEKKMTASKTKSSDPVAKYVNLTVYAVLLIVIVSDISVEMY